MALFPTLMMATATMAMPTDKVVSLSEAECLNYLYQYMTQPDKTDYTKEFYLENIRTSLLARQEMPWGKRVDNQLFRHFVLPVRVNNENLDESRMVFYKELKDRVKGLSMVEAVLEVNHWCHEKVTYQPSDARTSSPLASIRTAYGRCGEESTFLVAALRAVGIPARQVYTPRWAHTDDNHAWVEAWADGQWYFLGACEPEPILNLGWFNESASRGMLMHTKVFGDYKGTEEVISRTPFFTEINVIGNYAPCVTKVVRVIDENGKPVPNATIEFKIYNYAEFYTVAKKTTDSKGCASLTAGKGDMVVWVSKNGKCAFNKISFRDNEPKDSKCETVDIALTANALPSVIDFDITPPAISVSLPKVSAEAKKLNDERKRKEDAMRQAYEATMVDKSRGNHAVIAQFLREAKNSVMAQALLSVISDKDHRDIPLEVLKDNEVEQTDTTLLYKKYVLNPRVENEWLVPYKAFFRKELKGIASVENLLEWTRKNIKIDNANNPQHLRMSPISTYKARVTDALSYKIFFVSAARSLGFPARMNEIDGRLQYYNKGQWNDAEKVEVQKVITGKLKLNYQPSATTSDPKYYTHFTLSRLVDGRAQLLTYPEDATWNSTFGEAVELEEGQYLLTTGTRLANGGVLAHNEIVTIAANKQTSVQLQLRESKEEVQVIGSLNAENMYFDTKEGVEKSLLATAGRGYYVLGIIGANDEPSNHALRDIALVKSAFEQWGRKVFFLYENKESQERATQSKFDNLPETAVFGTDVDGKILAELREQLHLKSASLPVFVIADSFNRVVFVSQGYTIGLGEQIMKVVKKL